MKVEGGRGRGCKPSRRRHAKRVRASFVAVYTILSLILQPAVTTRCLAFYLKRINLLQNMVTRRI